MERRRLAGNMASPPPMARRRLAGNMASPPPMARRPLAGNMASPPPMARRRLAGNMAEPPPMERRRLAGNMAEPPPMERRRLAGNMAEPPPMEHRRLAGNMASPPRTPASGGDRAPACRSFALTTKRRQARETTQRGARSEAGASQEGRRSSSSTACRQGSRAARPFARGTTSSRRRGPLAPNDALTPRSCGSRMSGRACAMSPAWARRPA
jgi:hypothetical protein